MRQLILILIASILCMFSVKAHSKDITQLMFGTWDSGCFKINNDPVRKSKIDVYKIFKNRVQLMTRTFFNENCEDQSMRGISVIETELQLKNLSTDGSVVEIKVFPVISENLSFTHPDLVEWASKNKYCGFDNWAAGKFNDIKSESSSCKNDPYPTFDKFYYLRLINKELLVMDNCDQGEVLNVNCSELRFKRFKSH